MTASIAVAPCEQLPPHTEAPHLMVCCRLGWKVTTVPKQFDLRHFMVQRGVYMEEHFCVLVCFCWVKVSGLSSIQVVDNSCSI